MKKILLLIFFGFYTLFNLSYSQITTTPPYPTENDSITIIFDATQGGGGMAGYTGDLYTHTGVITNLSGGSWAYVIGTWGDNNSQPQLERIGTDLYKLVIGYPRIFYQISNTQEHILQLAFVFRSADASQQTEDLFVDIYDSGITVVVNSPEVTVEYGDPLRSPYFASQDEIVDIDIEAVEINTTTENLSLYQNDLLVEQTNSNTLFYSFETSAADIGANYFTAVAEDTAGISDTTEFVIFVNPFNENEAPPSNLVHGINYTGPTTATLILFAPAKDFVYLIGDFNDWKVDLNYKLKRHAYGPQEVVWWIEVDGLSPGVEYAFQYYVDGEIRIGDPYSEKILDPWNDQYINSITYPNLKPYPHQKTFWPVSVLKTGQAPYPWNVPDFDRPDKTDLVIYELLIRDFLSTHIYQTLTDTLGYLKRMGINAIELMPIMEFEGNESWGYNPMFHYAVDKYYGPKNDLKKFIDSCHAKGIAVIFDIVLNHAFGQSPLVRLYWDEANGRPAANNPWFNQEPTHPFNVGFDFNHESEATRYFVDRVLAHWVEDYNIDGFRFDLSKGFTQTYTGGNVGQWGQYDQSRIDNLTRIGDELSAIDNNLYLILEHFADNSEEIVLSDYGFMLWGNMNYNYNEATMGYTGGGNSDLTWGSYQARGWDDPNLVTYMESHDEERLMFKNLEYGNSNGNYDITELPTALNRIKLAGAFFFTIPGPKMFWQFGELGYDISIDYPCRLCNKPILWEYYDDVHRRNLYKTFQALLTLKNYDAFSSTDYSLNVFGAVKRININHTTMDVSIIGNFDVVSRNANPDFSRTGMWYQYFTGDSINVNDTQAEITLEPGEFRIYTTVKLPTPEPGIINDVENISLNNVVEDYGLEQNYPNPFNPATVIRYQIPEAGKVTLKVYDILGKEVAELINEEQTTGIYQVEFDADKLSSGVYFYTITAGDFYSTKKMLLIK